MLTQQRINELVETFRTFMVALNAGRLDEARKQIKALAGAGLLIGWTARAFGRSA